MKKNDKVIEYKFEEGTIRFRSPKHLKLKQARALSNLKDIDFEGEDFDFDQLIDTLKALCETKADEEQIEEMTIRETEEAFSMWGEAMGKEAEMKNSASSS